MTTEYLLWSTSSQRFIVSHSKECIIKNLISFFSVHFLDLEKAWVKLIGKVKTAAAGCTNAVCVVWWMGLMIMKWYRRIYPRREENYSRSLSPSPSSSSSSFSYMLRCMASSSFQKDSRVGVDVWRKRDTHTLYTATSCKFSYGFIFGMRKVMMTTTRKATKRKRKLCGTETLSCRHFSSSIITKPHIHTTHSKNERIECDSFFFTKLLYCIHTGFSAGGSGCQAVFMLGWLERLFEVEKGNGGRNADVCGK